MIALPTRDVLAFCDTSSDVGRTELLELIDRLRDSADQLLTQKPYVRLNGEWIPEDTV